MENQNLLDHNNLTSPQSKLLQNLKQENSNKTKQICALVRNCYDALNTFGKDAEALKTTQMLFAEILKPYPIDVITSSFWDYLGSETEIPKPAQIKELCERKVAKEKPKTVSNSGESQYTQQIRDYASDEILEENKKGSILTPMRIANKYGSRKVYERFRVGA